MGDKELLPSSYSEKRRSHGQDFASVWLRLSAFLSTRSPTTQATYKGILLEWCEFLGAKAGTPEGAKKLLGATDLHAIGFRSWLEKRPGIRPRSERRSGSSKLRAVSTEKRSSFGKKKEGLENTQSNATIWKKFAALRRMYRVLIACGAGITENPFDRDRVPPPSKEAGRKRPTEMISFELVSEIIQTPDISTAKGLQDRAILSCLFGGGLRRSEVAGLRIGDIKASRAGTIFLYLRSTKAKKDAEQALPKWAAQSVLDVREQRKREGALDGDYLFVSYRGRGGAVPTNEPMSHSGIYKLFKHYCTVAGAGAFVSPHSARATAITKLLDDGVSHRLVQEFSRHSSIQMVELYDKRRIGVDENPGKYLKF